MTRFRSLWLITLFTIILWMTFPLNAVTASQNQAHTPTPTAVIGNELISDISQAHYPGIVFGALAIVSIIFIGALAQATKR